MNILLSLLLGVILYTAFGIFTSRAGGKLNDNLVAVLSNAIGVILPLIVYFLFKQKQHMAPTKAGIMYSLFAGICIAAFSVLMVNLYSRAENVSFVMPVIYGGTIVLGSLIGLFFFKEHITIMGLVGLGFVSVGVGLLVFARLHP